MANFSRIGNDRFSHNVQRAFGNAPTGLVTGDITRGDVVTVTCTSGQLHTERVKPRRTGAIIIGVDLNAMCELHWWITDTTLTLKQNAARTGTVTFWVF